MNVAVFHGSPRRGNTYRATEIFLDGLKTCGGVSLTEFSFPEDLPVFCTGCKLCFVGRREDCPNAKYSAPIIDAILKSDALVFATPHYGACGMPASMKTLFDHIDSLVLNVSPREEMFAKKAFVITTGAGSAAAAKPIEKFLRHCGVNRVYSLGIRMFADEWDKMKEAKRERFEKTLRRLAKKFYGAKRKRPYLSSLIYFYAVSFIMKRYVGEGNYPYDNWKAKGYFDKRPF